MVASCSQQYLKWNWLKIFHCTYVKHTFYTIYVLHQILMIWQYFSHFQHEILNSNSKHFTLCDLHQMRYFLHILLTNSTHFFPLYSITDYAPNLHVQHSLVAILFTDMDLPSGKSPLQNNILNKWFINSP